MVTLNCLIIAGEKSGEEHAMSFLDDILSQCENIELWGVGGDLLKNKGVSLLYHLKDFSTWGFSEVIHKIPFYKKALKVIEDEVVRRQTKVAILIDFQDFNLRLARKLQKRGVKILYYVAPQAWVWKAGRAKKLEETVHTLFTIIPFERKWFELRGVKRVFGVNHPVYLTYKKELEAGLPERSYESMSKELNLVILPGSRTFEVQEMLPEFIQTIKTLRQTLKLKVLLVKSPNLNENLYSPYMDYIDESYIDTDLTVALKKSHLCLAASGTVTLTCALFEVPTVVCYRTSIFNAFIFYTFINYKGFGSLANIVHEEEVYPECVQEECDQTNILRPILKWFENKEAYIATKKKLKLTKLLLEGENSRPGLYMADVINTANRESR